MKKAVADVLADILTYSGAVVEKTDNNCMDVIVPPEVSHILNIPEYTRLSFSAGGTCDNAIYASYDSDLFNSIKSLFIGRGKFAIATFEPYIPNIEKISKVITGKTGFGNATFRLEKTEIANIDYLLIFFKYTALSDEKHEGIVPILINTLNRSIMIFENEIGDILMNLNPTDTDSEVHCPTTDILMEAVRSAYKACSGSVPERLKDFKKSLERRLNRDIKRVYEYYETLKEETVKSAEQACFDMSILIAAGRKRALKRNGTASKKEILSDIEKVEQEYLQKRAEIRRMLESQTWEWEKKEKIDKFLNKYSLIKSEQVRKVQDLVSKYTLSIQVEPVSAILIKTQILLFWINIKRRLASRQFPVAYNPFFKHLECLPCESCFYPQGSYYICDDKLHIVCSECFKECPKCGKQYCKACYNKCPKCGVKQIQED